MEIENITNNASNHDGEETKPGIPKWLKILILVLAVLILAGAAFLIYKKIISKPLAGEKTKISAPINYSNPYFKKDLSDYYLPPNSELVNILLIKDSDGDGLPDASENKLGRDPAKQDFVLFGVDTDSDKLGDIEEQKIGTDPKNQDTDGDDLTDWAEIFVYQTDPLKKDTDGDGAADSQEETALAIQNQIKAMRDSDHDGLVDGKEEELGTNPNKRDTDGDGLLDGPEVILKKDPKNKDYDSKAKDTDGDGLLDSDEERLGTSISGQDSDNDGLTDYEEVMIYYSDPLKSDTDGDGYQDGAEVKNGYDPIGPGKLKELPNYIRFTS